MIKKAWAVWKGGIKDGGGTISTETGVLKEALGLRKLGEVCIREGHSVLTCFSCMMGLPL